MTQTSALGMRLVEIEADARGTLVAKDIVTYKLG
jgi:hypothetical protein